MIGQINHNLLWIFSVRNGHIKRITDQDIQSSVLEIMGTNVSTNFITCPADPQKTLGIKLPFLVMIIKNVMIPEFSFLSSLNAMKSYSTSVSVEEVFYFRSASSGRQKCAAPIPRLKLSVHNARQAFHLHHAYAIG
jgi:hypothetical protein